METKITPHFYLWEFEVSQTATRHGINNALPPGLIPSITRLAERLEELRFILKAPIIITSGYRNRELNLLIGGSPNSYHMFGRAADIKVPGYTTKEIVEIIEAHNIQFTEIVDEYNGAWLHLAV